VPFIDQLSELPAELLLASYERAVKEYDVFFDPKATPEKLKIVNEREENLAKLRAEIVRRITQAGVKR
jgi:hypothetical protein